MAQAAVTSYVLDQEVSDDYDIDDIETLPRYVVFPTGSYKVTLAKGIVQKEINKNSYYEIQLTLKEVLELSPSNLSEGETIPEAGDMGSLLYDRGHKIGMGNFKEFILPICAAFNTKNVGTVRESSHGLDMIVVIKRTYNKDKDRFNMNCVASHVV